MMRSAATVRSTLSRVPAQLPATRSRESLNVNKLATRRPIDIHTDSVDEIGVECPGRVRLDQSATAIMKGVRANAAANTSR